MSETETMLRARSSSMEEACDEKACACVQCGVWGWLLRYRDAGRETERRGIARRASAVD